MWSVLQDCEGKQEEQTGSVDKARLCHKDSSELCRRVMTVRATDCRERLKYEEEELQAKP